MNTSDKLQDGWLVDLGHAGYVEVLDLQRAMAQLRYENRVPDTLLLVEHEPVITLGRRRGSQDNILSTDEELASQGIKIYRVERGGDVTYHGPGQLVGYPIIHLGQRELGVRTFVELLEEAVILTLADFDIKACRDGEWRGVWVRDLKVAAVGVAVRRWVSFHGFALNVSPRMDHYCHINPCALDHQLVTSMANLVKEAPSMKEVEATVARRFTELFPGHWQELGYEELVEAAKLHRAVASEDETRFK